MIRTDEQGVPSIVQSIFIDEDKNVAYVKLFDGSARSVPVSDFVISEKEGMGYWMIEQYVIHAWGKEHECT